MGKKFDWFEISDQEKENWEALCPTGEFRVIEANKLPPILPNALTDQYDSVLVMASGSADGVTYYMANGNRVDAKAGEIDQMPYGITFIGDNPIYSGSLIQHGDWPSRSIEPPLEFWDYVKESGIGNCFPVSELPKTSSGKLENLGISSQDRAFEALVEELKKHI